MVSNRYDTTHLNIKALMMLKWHPTTALQLDLLWIVLKDGHYTKQKTQGSFLPTVIHKLPP